jgi:hypothetical protein
MKKNRIKPNYRRRVLRLPDLDHCKTAVLNSLGSPSIASSSCATACTSNQDVWLRTPLRTRHERHSLVASFCTLAAEICTRTENCHCNHC